MKTAEQIYKKYKNFLSAVTKEEVIRIIEQIQKEACDKAKMEMYLNMQYYMEYCRANKYVTPQEWIEKHKHF